MLETLMKQNEEIVKNLKPANVFKFFAKLCSIPHGSSNTLQISNYLVEFAKEHNLKYEQDQSNNVIIWKEATPGYEQCEPVILQGHMDMVCEKKDGYEIDFINDGLQLKTDGKYLWADGTTLGGDDGIAVAYALAILDSKEIAHPALEVVVTVDEEIGMLGAAAIDLKNLKSNKLINIDSEDEGIFLTSCAGGLTLNGEIPFGRQEKEGVGYKLTIEGLKGGHSGCEIDKGRANANVIAARVLFELSKELDIDLINMAGGLKDNAIPRKTVVEIGVNEKDSTKFEQSLQLIEQNIKSEYQTSDPEFHISKVDMGKNKYQVVEKNSLKSLLCALVNLPNGIQSMSMDISGLVETSLNLGILTMSNKTLNLKYSVRSSIESAKHYLTNRIISLIEYFGGTSSITGDYTGWAYKKDSELRKKFIKHYQDLYKEEPKIEAIHAGLECGIFTDKIENLDCISFGPNILSIHTFEEKLDIASTERTWDLLISVLADKND